MLDLRQAADLPVTHETEVLVVGGGPAGVAAAFASARMGAKTLIVEQFNCLGGVATAGGHGCMCLYSEWGTNVSEENQVLADSLLVWRTDYSDPFPGSDGEISLLPPSTEFEDLFPYENSWFEKVTYKGAFGSNNWIEGWTLLDEILRKEG